MKKRVFLTSVFIALGVGFLYILIPGKINIYESETLSVNSRGFTRTFLDEKKWHQWWPEQNLVRQSHGRLQSFRFNGDTYTILEKKLTSVVISIKNETDSLVTELMIIPLNAESVKVSWIGQTIASLNPLSRLRVFIKTKKLSVDLSTILQQLEKFYLNEDNIYGIHIEKSYVIDSTLISTSDTSKSYPSIEKIYNLIDELKFYASKNQAKQTGLPMLNVTTTDSINYFTRVALPVDRKLKDSGNIVYRWMLGGGNILVTEVKGGPYNINNAFTEMENYVNDFRRTAPAIPFESLVTDRRKEPDTNKWVTKVYWPVM